MMRVTIVVRGDEVERAASIVGARGGSPSESPESPTGSPRSRRQDLESLRDRLWDLAQTIGISLGTSDVGSPRPPSPLVEEVETTVESLSPFAEDLRRRRDGAAQHA
jgi:hypothetical protein